MALQEIISPLLTDLYYPSESDEPLEWFVIASEDDTPINETAFRTLLSIAEETPVAALDLSLFWERVTTTQPWYREAEIQAVERFEEIQRTINEHLTEVQGFRVGEVEINVYLFGRNEEGNLEGIKTLLVET